jgi:hypothetical protein
MAEMAATDPEYGVDMRVDGINYRRGDSTRIARIVFRKETMKAASEVTML